MLKMQAIVTDNVAAEDVLSTVKITEEK